MKLPIPLSIKRVLQLSRLHNPINRVNPPNNVTYSAHPQDKYHKLWAVTLSIHPPTNGTYESLKTQVAASHPRFQF